MNEPQRSRVPPPTGAALAVAALMLLLAGRAAGVSRGPGDYFAIQVVDQQTGRGVPLVLLRTVHDVRYYTDSAGVAAFYEPGLMDRDVFFFVESHGYEFPADRFGFRGKRLRTTPGGQAVLKIRRINVAERLYRVTGAGIYRDSVLVGRRPPIRQPLLNALVLGSDSVVTAMYRGKIYWFWGDTNRPSYPLGNFHVPGAVSLPREKGGLDPEVGVDLDYFVDDRGFAQETARMPGPGPTWIDGLVTLKDKSGVERLFAKYVKVKKPMVIYERGLAEFNDRTRRFEKRVQLDMDAPLFPSGHPFQHRVEGVEYVYFASPYPLTRVRASPADLANPDRYETFTCLRQGARESEPALDRDQDGALRYGWKRDTSPWSAALQQRLLKNGLLQPGEALLQLQDVETGKRVVAHRGSVYWNAYRRRWVLIAVQAGGTSYLGEVWFAEADSPVGPWVYARKVVTHDRYSFYNPKQQPMLAKESGRVLFFEGTYTTTFSGNSDRTPRYNYNQIMYKLDLSDPRLTLPVPVYGPSSNGRSLDFAARRDAGAEGPERDIAFFALDRPAPGAVAVRPGSGASSGRLERVSPSPAGDAASGPAPLFYALPAKAAAAPAAATPLDELVSLDRNVYRYELRGAPTPRGFQRSKEPFCRVWKNPLEIRLPRE